MRVEAFVRALEPRLYHACQLRDLELYARLGHVASRREMFDLEDTEQYTPFESDEFDVENDHDRSVFGNLSDGGNAYNNGRGMPNAYGPITLEFRAGAVARSGATEIHVREYGVFTRNVDGAQAITTPAALHGLYVASDGFGKGEFEITDGTLRMEDALRVTVAPLVAGGRRLIDVVGDVLRDVVDCEIVERAGRFYRSDHYARLIDWAAQVRLHGGDAARLPDGFADWYGAINVAEPTRGNNLRRFANYMEHGTLSRLRNEAGHLTAAPEEVDHDPDVESENECYDRYDVTSYAELSVSELKERDEYVAQIRQARAMAISSGHRYGALLEDGAPADALEDARNQAQLDYDTLVDTVNEANDWIDGIRERIDWSIDEVSHMSASAHDSIVVDELQGWKDSLESIAFAPHVRFDEEFDRRRYDLEIDVSPLREMQTEIDEHFLYIGPED